MKRILQLWHSIDSGFQKVEQSIIVFGLMTILITGVLSIVLRNTVGWGLAFAEILARQLTVWLGLLGATLATTSAEHINIDALSRLLKRRGLQMNRVFVSAMCVVGSVIFTYCAVMFVVFYYNNPVTIELASLKIPNWLLLLVFPASMILMTVRYLVHTIEYFYAFQGDVLPGSIAERQQLEDEERELISSGGAMNKAPEEGSDTSEEEVSEASEAGEQSEREQSEGGEG